MDSMLVHVIDKGTGDATTERLVTADFRRIAGHFDNCFTPADIRYTLAHGAPVETSFRRYERAYPDE